MITSTNKLNIELQAIADAHLQVNTYYWGDFPTAVNSQEIVYPLMNCYYTGGSFDKVTVPIDLFVVVSDKVFKGHTNLNDTESDTLQVIRDIYEVVNKSPRWQNIGKVLSATVNKFIDRGRDEVAGHVLQMSFKLYDSQSICDLPMQGYNFESSASLVACDPVLIVNSDGSFSVSAPAGTTYILPDTTINVYYNGVLQISQDIPTLEP